MGEGDFDEFDLNLGNMATTFESISNNLESMRIQTPSTSASSNRGVRRFPQE